MDIEKYNELKKQKDLLENQLEKIDNEINNLYTIEDLAEKVINDFIEDFEGYDYDDFFIDNYYDDIIEFSDKFTNKDVFDYIEKNYNIIEETNTIKEKIFDNDDICSFYDDLSNSFDDYNKFVIENNSLYGINDKKSVKFVKKS